MDGRKLSIVLHIFAAFFRFLSLCSGRPISLYRWLYYSALRECACLRMRTIQLRRAELLVQRGGSSDPPAPEPPCVRACHTLLGERSEPHMDGTSAIFHILYYRTYVGVCVTPFFFSSACTVRSKKFMHSAPSLRSPHTCPACF